jgi:hypothetical protein
METEPTPLVGGASYDAPSSALFICFGLLQLIWVTAFFASVPILLAARARRPRQMSWWLVSILAAASGWTASIGFSYLEAMSIQAASEAAFRQGYFAHYWMWAPPSLTLPWGWIVGLVYLLVCLTAYPLVSVSERGLTSRPFKGLTIVAVGLFVATYVPPWANTDLFRAGPLGYSCTFLLFLFCAGISVRILRAFRLHAPWWPFMVMFSATLIIRPALRMALDASDHVVVMWPFERQGNWYGEWAALFAGLFTAFWWIAIRARPGTSSHLLPGRSEAPMLVTPLGRAALSALTLFGGHFLNQRLDRVVLIATLLVSAVAISLGILVAIFHAGDQWAPVAIWAPWLPLLLMSALLVISVVLTFSDARTAAVGPPTTTIQLIRLPLTLFGVVVISALCFLGWIDTRAQAARSREAMPIVGRIEFGYGPVASTRTALPAPPSGSEPLRGRIMLDGVGVEDAALSLMLNGEYRVELDSDSRGRFKVSLPPGGWDVNEIVLREWNRRPANRDLILFSGYEPKRRGGMYSGFSCYTSNGLPVSLPSAAKTTPLELELRDAIAVTWPPPGPGSADSRPSSMPVGELATAAVAWSSVKGASLYEVQIFSIKEGPLKGYSTPILTRHTSRSTLPLASLPQRSATASEDEYGIRILAFDAQRRLLSKTSEKANFPGFKLTGARRLGEETQYVNFDGSRAWSAEYRLNENRLDEAERLLNEKRFEEARRVLDEVTSDARPGGASALRGQLAALSGDCVTATRLFDQAEQKEEGCVGNEARALCGVSRKWRAGVSPTFTP